jgi:hypothetical protein
MSNVRRHQPQQQETAMTDTTEGFRWGEITADNDPERWKMEMIDAVFDGLCTLKRLLDAKRIDDALNKLNQVGDDVCELRNQMLKMWKPAADGGEEGGRP